MDDRLEAAIYYIFSEAVTNAVQQACASTVWVELAMDDAAAWLSVRDDGMRGAEPAGGHGLIGLKDRVEALGGALQVQAAAEGGSHVLVRVPIWTG